MKKYINQRSEKEMFDLILNIGKNDDRVLAVYLNGSRANSKVKKDQYQDYDIVYVVKDVKEILDQQDFINQFGDIAIKQEPDLLDYYLHKRTNDFSTHYTWLTLFKDGNRIDLTIINLETALKDVVDDSLTIILLDKDNYLPSIKKANDDKYLPKKPDEGEFYSCFNEFYWCLNNVAKGLCRKQIPYAMYMYNTIVRNMLDKMISYYVGIKYDYKVSPGKLGKYYSNTLPKKYYKMYLKTYSNGKINNIWKSVFVGCKLFDILANNVADSLNYSYNKEEKESSISYLINMKKGLYKVEE